MQDQNRILTAALAGCGRIGSYTAPELRERISPGWLPLSHADAMMAVPGLRLAAVCDVNPDHANRAARTYEAAPFTDAEEMFRAIPIDILAIATRTAPRLGLFQQAFASGVKGIHCEKPIAINLSDCRSILEGCARHGIALSYGTTRRYMDIFRLAQEMVRAGEIGLLQEVETQLNQNRLLWTHPHSADIVLFFAENRNLVSVRARCLFAEGAIGERIIDDDPVVEQAEIDFDGGFKGRFSNIRGNNVILRGERGVIRILDDGRFLEVEKAGGATLPRDFKVDMSGTQRAFQELSDAVRGKGRLAIEPEHIERGLQILLAIAHSGAQGGRVIELAELDDRFTVTGRIGELAA